MHIGNVSPRILVSLTQSFVASLERSISEQGMRESFLSTHLVRKKGVGPDIDTGHFEMSKTQSGQYQALSSGPGSRNRATWLIDRVMLIADADPS